MLLLWIELEQKLGELAIIEAPKVLRGIDQQVRLIKHPVIVRGNDRIEDENPYRLRHRGRDQIVNGLARHECCPMILSDAQLAKQVRRERFLQLERRWLR